MNRREFLAAAGASLTLSAGAYGLAYRDGDNPPVRQGTEPPTVTPPTARPPTQTPTATPLPTGITRAGTTLSGISPCSESAAYFTALEDWLGVHPAIAVIFANMAQTDAELEATIDRLEFLWQRGYVPMLFLQPNFGSTTEEVNAVARRVGAGRYDDRLTAWGSALSAWALRPETEPDRRVYLNLGPEFNGDWIPWGVPNDRTTPADYVRMWRRIHDRIMDSGLQNNHVQWVWTANCTSIGPVDIEACYPGDSYVDWVGITGYNWVNWGWSTPEELYGPMYRTIREITDKPLAIAEFGASADCPGGHCPDRKEAWIADVYEYFIENDVRMACWFDHWIAKDDTDWGVFNSEFGTELVQFHGNTVCAYGMFQKTVQREAIVHAHPIDARRLTDDEFFGAFTKIFQT